MNLIWKQLVLLSHELGLGIGSTLKNLKKKIKAEKTSREMVITNTVVSEILTLPLHSCMDKTNEDYVIEKINEFYKLPNVKENTGSV